jgi:hypothetical protein
MIGVGAEIAISAFSSGSSIAESALPTKEGLPWH